MSHVVDDDAPAWAIRLEGKWDGYMLSQAHLKSNVEDHEKRLRAIESRPTVTPMGLATALAMTVTVSGGFIALINSIIP